ncbi:DUF1015 domain-containing protein [Acetobacterium sp. K1/6]|uniref:DUF1015 domain-containing protein n=1 Tax=Acetobacterium sp. K1/6 TaxID=3055467 RepID=UPI002ACAA426|nr:DUF1015 family protein [Acetobacterium sp. K1/6]MDZ5725350.1 DUF1015 family protein [Acetobacterium sp. K1/6]
MATIKPFKAVRPFPEKAQDVAALPYDVYNREEAAIAARGKLDSFLRVDRPETTLDERIKINDPFVYETARKNLEKLFHRNALTQDTKDCLYIYELIMDGRSQVGLVVCTAIDEYLDNTIKKHELTRADKEEDRIKHVDACNANTGPIFLTYRAQDAINEMVDSWRKANEPVYDFVAEDGITHRAWIVDDEAVINGLIEKFGHVDSLYIADGHHRSASAVKVGLMRREANPEYTGEEEFNYFLSVLFPDEQLYIMDYNRVVKDLNGLSVEEFLNALSEKFDVTPKDAEPVTPPQKGSFGLFVDKKWYLLTVKEGVYDPADPVNSLDVAILQNNILIPILGIGDIRTDKRIDFVGGIRGLNELERRVSEDMVLAFSMYPTAIEELMNIADADMVMPPKSTWFEPKLRSGLFIHNL